MNRNMITLLRVLVSLIVVADVGFCYYLLYTHTYYQGALGILELILTMFMFLFPIGAAIKAWRENSKGLAIAIFITTFLLPLIPQLLALGALFEGPVRKQGPSKFWKCPQCQTILIKGSPELASLLGPGKIVGIATCTSCSATFSQSMVYSGVYDVPEVALNCPYCQTQLQGSSEMLLGKPCPSCQRTLPS